MNQANDECPKCRSVRLTTGRMLTKRISGTDFQPDGLRSLIFTFSSHRVKIEEPFRACLDCGLFWSEASPQELRAIIAKYGKPETKERLLGPGSAR